MPNQLDELLLLSMRMQEAISIIGLLGEFMDQSMLIAEDFAPAIKGAHTYLTSLGQDLEQWAKTAWEQAIAKHSSF